MDEQRWFLGDPDPEVDDDEWAKAIEDAHLRDLRDAFADSDAA